MSSRMFGRDFPQTSLSPDLCQDMMFFNATRVILWTVPGTKASCTAVSNSLRLMKPGKLLATANHGGRGWPRCARGKPSGLNLPTSAVSWKDIFTIFPSSQRSLRCFYNFLYVVVPQQTKDSELPNDQSSLVRIC